MREPFPELVVLSRDEVQSFIAGNEDVCISISDPGYEPARLSANFRAVLRVQFHDWPWPDFSDRDGQITAEQAEEIVRCALEHRVARRLVIHCHAGVSRSTSAAQALAVHVGRRWWFPKWFRAEYRRERRAVNPEVFNAIADAFGRIRPGDRVIQVQRRTKGQSAIGGPGRRSLADAPTPIPSPTQEGRAALLPPTADDGTPP